METENVSRDRSVGIETGYGLDYSLLYSVQTGSGAYPVGPRGSFPEVKAAVS
jgi:hypothetical protein